MGDEDGNVKLKSKHKFQNMTQNQGFSGGGWESLKNSSQIKASCQFRTAAIRSGMSLKMRQKTVRTIRLCFVCSNSSHG